MMRYISDKSNLKIIMQLLRHKQPAIQFEAFHVFKVRSCSSCRCSVSKQEAPYFNVWCCRLCTIASTANSTLCFHLHFTVVVYALFASIHTSLSLYTHTLLPSTLRCRCIRTLCFHPHFAVVVHAHFSAFIYWIFQVFVANPFYFSFVVSRGLGICR